MTIPSLTRRKQWLHVGFDMTSNERLDLSLDLFRTHLHAVGPPGVGKTREILNIFQQLSRIPEATIFVSTSKGDLCHQARDSAINSGLTRRLLWFPGDQGNIIGYSPLRPNGLPVATHAKAVREGIRASWGQADFDQTAQLARLLFVVLFAVRELELTLVEALGLLRPGSQVRQAILPAIRDPYIRESLDYFDSLREQRQDELAASALARLESFVLDPTIRQMLTQQNHSLNFGQLIANHSIILAPFLDYAPLRPDDNRLLVRLMINDIVAHVFNRPKEQRTPVFLILDECQTAVTADLCRALDQGRELGLFCILAHQFLHQLATEETSGLLYHSVMKCARTKLLFGGLSTEDLEILTPEVMIDQFDPWRVKNELTTLECEPLETRREVVTEGESASQSLERTEGSSHSHTQGKQLGRGRAVGFATQIAVVESQGETESRTEGTANTSGYASSSGHASSSGGGSLITSGETILPGETGLWGGDIIHSSSLGSSSFSSAADINSASDISSSSDIRTSGHASTRMVAKQRALGQNLVTSQNEALSQSQSQAENTSMSVGRSAGKNRSKSITPWHEYRKRRIVSSRQFLNKEEQLTLFLQKIKSLPKGHFLLKAPGHEAVFVRAPLVKEPWISSRKRAVALERVYQQSCYSTPQAIETEEQERAKRILQLAGAPLPAERKAPKMKKGSPPASPRTTRKPKTPWDEPIGRE